MTGHPWPGSGHGRHTMRCGNFDARMAPPQKRGLTQTIKHIIIPCEKWHIFLSPSGGTGPELSKAWGRRRTPLSKDHGWQAAQALWRKEEGPYPLPDHTVKFAWD